MTEYEIIGMDLEQLTKKRSLRLNIRFQRLYGLFFLTLFIPSLCLIGAAGLTLFVDKSHFDVNVQVALTSTLVMYTLFGSVGEKLPDTGYIKMVDIWLIHGLMNPFIIFLAHFLSNLLDKKYNKISGKKSAKRDRSKRSKFDRHCQKIIPFFTMLFIMVFFAFAFFRQET